MVHDEQVGGLVPTAYADVAHWGSSPCQGEGRSSNLFIRLHYWLLSRSFLAFPWKQQFICRRLTPYDLCVSSSVIEHLLAKERVESSNLFIRFRYWLLSRSFLFAFHMQTAIYLANGLTPYDFCVCSSVVEHLLAKERVEVRISSSTFYWLKGQSSLAFPFRKQQFFDCK